ncbi:YcxB family protein [Pseudoflavonifractor phocaeensis]|uniref:YcxB family protein n=1 Tax=Pseudoflavonifractor phocaeensis TaxID=1870988 RepID=UPI0019584DB8|nr:YcxB family protein [Pseudoflavonifractor phocaeensis]MBM6871007.1 YcxB family protein [Pseudoflavonifractor phocaeensis]MBM6936931.1 YcxB family protein [Pseudoflavonifractor phocaeensis]
MEDEMVRLSFRLTRKEYTKAVRFYLRKSWRVSWLQGVVLVLALAGVLWSAWAMGALDLLHTFALVLLLLVAGVLGWVYLIQPGRTFARDPQLSQPVRFCFSAEDIVRETEEKAEYLDWQVKRFWRSRQFYYLFQADGSWLLLPRRAFGSAQDQGKFEDLVRRVNGEAQVRFFGS